MKTFCVFSDSIGVGQGVSPHKSWVHLLSAWLGDDWYVINASRNGDTTRLALERMKYDVLSHQPDIVYVQFGMNDANVWADAHGIPRVDADAFKWNMHEIAARLRAIHAEPVFATNNGTKVPCISWYDSKTVEVAEMLKLRIVHHCYGPEALLPDGVHLSSRGHELYFEKIRGLFT